MKFCPPSELGSLRGEAYVGRAETVLQTQPYDHDKTSILSPYPPRGIAQGRPPSSRGSPPAALMVIIGPSIGRRVSGLWSARTG